VVGAEVGAQLTPQQVLKHLTVAMPRIKGSSWQHVASLHCEFKSGSQLGDAVGGEIVGIIEGDTLGE